MLVEAVQGEESLSDFSSQVGQISFTVHFQGREQGLSVGGGVRSPKLLLT